ncbi:mucin-4-like [Mytilus trossulus]|uniref:mucin-4-like n=1 Tax=Mytilus trossulus TaxID=6551 RepID=UPI003005A8FA
MTERIDESIPSPETLNSAISVTPPLQSLESSSTDDASMFWSTKNISNTMFPSTISSCAEQNVTISPTNSPTQSSNQLPFISPISRSFSTRVRNSCEDVIVDQETEIYNSKLNITDSQMQHTLTATDAMPTIDDSSVEINDSFNDDSDVAEYRLQCDYSRASTPSTLDADSIMSLSLSFNDSDDDSSDMNVEEIVDETNDMVDNGINDIVYKVDNKQSSQMSTNFNETVITNSHTHTISTYQCPAKSDDKISKSTNEECIFVTCDDKTCVTDEKGQLDVLKNDAFEKSIVPVTYTYTDVISGLSTVETQVSHTEPLHKEAEDNFSESKLSSKSNEKDQGSMMTTYNMIKDGFQQHHCDTDDVNKNFIQTKLKQNNSDSFSRYSYVDKISTSTDAVSNTNGQVDMFCKSYVSTNMDKTGLCFSNSSQLFEGDIMDFNKSLLLEVERGIQNSVIKEDIVTENQMRSMVCPGLQTDVSSQISNNIETPSSFEFKIQTAPVSMVVAKENLVSTFVLKPLKSVVNTSHPIGPTLLLGKSDCEELPSKTKGSGCERLPSNGSECERLHFKSCITSIPVQAVNSNLELKGNSEEPSNHSSTYISMVGLTTTISKDSIESFGSTIRPCTVIAGHMQIPMLSAAVPNICHERIHRSILTNQTPVPHHKQLQVKKKDDLINNQIAIKKSKETELYRQYITMSSGGKTIVSPISNSVYTNSLLKPGTKPPLIYRLDATLKNHVSTNSNFTTESDVPILVKGASGKYTFAYLNIENDGKPKSKANEKKSVIPKVNTSVNTIKVVPPNSSLNNPTLTKLLKDNSISPIMSNSSTVPTMTSSTSMLNLTRLLTSNLSKSSATTTCTNMSSRPISSVTSVLPIQQKSKLPTVKDMLKNDTLSEFRKTKRLVRENLALLQKTNCGSKDLFDTYSDILKTIENHENSMFETSTMVNKTLNVPPNDCVTSTEKPLVTNFSVSLPRVPLFSQVSKVPEINETLQTKTAVSGSATKSQIPVIKQSENQSEGLKRPIVVKVVYGTENIKGKTSMTTHDYILDESTGHFRPASCLDEKDKTMKTTLSVPKETTAVYDTTETNTCRELYSAETSRVSAFTKTRIKSWYSNKCSASLIPCTKIKSTLTSTHTTSTAYTNSVPWKLPWFNKVSISSNGNPAVKSQQDKSNIVSSHDNRKLVTYANTKVVSSLPQNNVVSPYSSKSVGSQFSNSNGISPKNDVPSKVSAVKSVRIDKTASSSLVQNIQTKLARKQKLIPYYSLYDKDLPHKRLTKDTQNDQSTAVPISIPSTVIQRPATSNATTNATVNILVPSPLYKQNDSTADGFNCASDRYEIASKQSGKVQKVTPHHSVYDKNLLHMCLPKDPQSDQSITVPISIPSTVIQSPSTSKATTNATVNILVPSPLYKQNDLIADGFNCASDRYGIASKQSHSGKVHKLTLFHTLNDKNLTHKRLSKDPQNYQSITVPISIPSTVIQSRATAQATTNATVDSLPPSPLFKQNVLNSNGCNCISRGCNCALDGYGIKIDSVYSLREVPKKALQTTRSFLRYGSETETDDEGEQATYFRDQFYGKLQKTKVKLNEVAKKDERLRKPCYVVLQDLEGKSVLPSRCTSCCRKYVVRSLCQRIFTMAMILKKELFTYKRKHIRSRKKGIKKKPTQKTLASETPISCSLTSGYTPVSCTSASGYTSVTSTLGTSFTPIINTSAPVVTTSTLPFHSFYIKSEPGTKVYGDEFTASNKTEHDTSEYGQNVSRGENDNASTLSKRARIEKSTK